MKEITEQMLRDRFALGFMFGVMSTILVAVSTIGFYIYFQNKNQKP
jgi:preprotein translocase subunit SecF